MSFPTGFDIEIRSRRAKQGASEIEKALAAVERRAERAQKRLDAVLRGRTQRRRSPLRLIVDDADRAIRAISRVDRALNQTLSRARRVQQAAARVNVAQRTSQATQRARSTQQRVARGPTAQEKTRLDAMVRSAQRLLTTTRKTRDVNDALISRVRDLKRAVGTVHTQALKLEATWARIVTKAQAASLAQVRAGNALSKQAVAAALTGGKTGVVALPRTPGRAIAPGRSAPRGGPGRGGFGIGASGGIGNAALIGAGARGVFGGSAVGGAGLGALGAGAGIAGVAFAISEATRSSVEFDKTLSRIVGLVGVAESQVDGFRRAILEIGPAVAKGPNELAEAMFFITSAGQRGAIALETLEASAMAATAGLGETKVVADAVTSALNAYGTANLTAADAAGILVATVREGKAEADSIAQSFGRVLPIASEMGVSFDQVGAAVAALTRLGLNSNEAVTALRATLSSILNPAKQSEDQLMALGISSEELRRVVREDGLLDALILLKDTFGDNQDAMAQVFPELRALTGVLALVGENADATRVIFEKLAKAGREDLAAAFATAAEQDAVKLERILVQIQAAAEGAGRALRSVLVPSLGFVGNRLTEFVRNTENAIAVYERFRQLVGQALPTPGGEFDIDEQRAQIDERIERSPLRALTLGVDDLVEAGQTVRDFEAQISSSFSTIEESAGSLPFAITAINTPIEELAKRGTEALRKQAETIRSEIRTLQTELGNQAEQLQNLEGGNFLERLFVGRDKEKAEAAIGGILGTTERLSTALNRLDQAAKVAEEGVTGVGDGAAQADPKIAEMRKSLEEMIVAANRARDAAGLEGPQAEVINAWFELRDAAVAAGVGMEAAGQVLEAFEARADATLASIERQTEQTRALTGVAEETRPFVTAWLQLQRAIEAAEGNTLAITAAFQVYLATVELVTAQKVDQSFQDSDKAAKDAAKSVRDLTKALIEQRTSAEREVRLVGVQGVPREVIQSIFEYEDALKKAGRSAKNAELSTEVFASQVEASIRSTEAETSRILQTLNLDEAQRPFEEARISYQNALRAVGEDSDEAALLTRAYAAEVAKLAAELGASTTALDFEAMKLDKVAAVLGESAVESRRFALETERLRQSVGKYGITQEQVNQRIKDLEFTRASAELDELAKIVGTDSVVAVERLDLRFRMLEERFQDGLVSQDNYITGLQILKEELEGLGDAADVMGERLQAAGASAAESLSSGISGAIVEGDFQGIADQIGGFFQTAIASVIEETFVRPRLQGIFESLAKVGGPFGDFFKGASQALDTDKLTPDGQALLSKQEEQRKLLERITIALEREQRSVSGRDPAAARATGLPDRTVEPLILEREPLEPVVPVFDTEKVVQADTQNTTQVTIRIDETNELLRQILATNQASAGALGAGGSGSSLGGELPGDTGSGVVGGIVDGIGRGLGSLGDLLMGGLDRLGTRNERGSSAEISAINRNTSRSVQTTLEAGRAIIETTGSGFGSSNETVRNTSVLMQQGHDAIVQMLILIWLNGLGGFGHQGGLVGSSGLIGASRGGRVGRLGANEVPIIAEQGEFLTPLHNGAIRAVLSPSRGLEAVTPSGVRVPIDVNNQAMRSVQRFRTGGLVLGPTGGVQTRNPITGRRFPQDPFHGDTPGRRVNRGDPITGDRPLDHLARTIVAHNMRTFGTPLIPSESRLSPPHFAPVADGSEIRHIAFPSATGPDFRTRRVEGLPPTVSIQNTNGQTQGFLEGDNPAINVTIENITIADNSGNGARSAAQELASEIDDALKARRRLG